jgi:hypothetical protein
VPTINLTDDELAAVTAAIRRTIEDDRFPHAPRSASRGAGKVRGGFRANPAPESPAASQRQTRSANALRPNRLSP